MPKISWEGTVGLLLEIAVGILDRLHINEPTIIWGLFALGFVLLSDAILRSEWASKPTEPKIRIRNRICGMVPLVFGAFIFGVLIYGRQKTELVAEKPAPIQTQTLQTAPPPSPSPTPQGKEKPKANPKPKQLSQEQKNSGGTNTQQQSSGNNSPIISAPNGIAIGGGSVTNPTVNNYGSMDRHVTPIQSNGLAELAHSIPKDAPVLFFIAIPDDEARTFAEELALPFAKDGRAFRPATGRSWRPETPKGVVLTVRSPEDPAFPLANRISTTMTNLGIPGVELMVRPDLKENYISVTVRMSEF